MKTLKIIFALVLIVGFFTPVYAAHELDTARLSWTANGEPDLAGYCVYFGTVSGEYGPCVDVENVIEHELTLEPGVWFFAVTAYDFSGNESVKSNVVSKLIAVIPGDHTAPLPPTLSIVEEVAKAIKHLGEALTMLVQGDALKVE